MDEWRQTRSCFHRADGCKRDVRRGRGRCLWEWSLSQKCSWTNVKRFVNLPPGARSRRHDGHDYRGGAYFVTTNTRKRIPLFGSVERGRMYLSNYGNVVAEEWTRTGELRDEVSLDAFIVMPDHVHGLLWICHPDEEPEQENASERDTSQGKESGMEGREKQPGNKGREARLATSQKLPPGLEERRAGTLSTIIGAFKSAATRRINERRDSPEETVWQSSFHDRIVRNREELHRIRSYIRTNPMRWNQSD